jgi:UDP-N-acetylglucosamine 2-epimerase (non-hydrolysing)/GDP/UDP-N,N'-diacetylbacillosamine 2-epimerase (hydrolysing)
VRQSAGGVGRISEYRVLLTCPNSDPVIARSPRAEKFAAERAGRCRYSRRWQNRYLSALRFVTAVIGNSSSGLIEVPSFGIPTLDIGIRQRGRTAGPGVLHCGVAKNSIAEGIRKILTPDFRSVAARRENPYDKPGTTQTIHDILQAADLRQLQIKRFCSVDF